MGITARIVPWSSVVGQSVTLHDEESGCVVAQLSIRCYGDAVGEQDIEACAGHVAKWVVKAFAALNVKPHFNGLTPAEHERLAYLMEESGEVIQIIGKIMRHGYESYDPTDPNNKAVGVEGQGVGRTLSVTTNRDLLARELGDVLRGVDMLVRGKEIDRDELARTRAKGPPSKYMHHQGGG